MQLVHSHIVTFFLEYEYSLCFYELFLTTTLHNASQS